MSSSWLAVGSRPARRDERRLQVAARSRAEGLFLCGALWASFGAGAVWPTRTSATSLTARAARAALTTRTARAALALRWPQLLQLLHLLRGEDLLELRLHFGLQGRDLLLLIGGEVELFLGARWHQVKPARPAAGAAFTARRSLPGRLLIAVLRGERARGSAQRQREEDDFRSHGVFCLYRVVPAPAVCIASMQ
jgi:hypothetical protein